MKDEDLDKRQSYKDKIETWMNRAAMAYQQKNMELAKQALDRRWQFQIKLAELEGTQRPDPPDDPEEYFKGLDRGSPRGGGPNRWPYGSDPDNPARVPKRPLPTAGAGEVALPLPDHDEI